MKFGVSPMLVFVILFLFESTVSNAQEKRFTIGCILPLSGEFATFAEGARRGMILAKESLPDDIKQNVQIIVEDDKSDPKGAVTAFKKLQSMDNIDSVITWSSGTSKAVAPIAESAKIPMIAIASDPSIPRGKKYVFNMWITPEEETRLLILEAAKRNYKKVAIITTSQDGLISLRRAFIEASKGKIQIALNEEYPQSEKDFKLFINKLLRLQNMDAVLVILAPGQIGIFSRQLREYGGKQPLFSYEVMEDESEVRVANGAMDGGWFATSGIPEETFTNRLRKRFPGDLIMYSAAEFFDALTILAAFGVRDQTPEKISQSLRSLKDYEGAIGKFSATGDNRFSLPGVLKIVTKEGFKPLY